MPDNQKKLGLNIIVGAGEAKVLERCLKSVQGIKFDEIVITHATRLNDEEVLAVARKYATKVATFTWCDDFSAARNYSFGQNEAVHLLWLDADDVVKESEHAKINALIDKLKDLDVILMDYVYSHDDKDRPVLTLPRERIVRNTQKIRWHDPIHEYLNMDGSMRIQRVDIKIDHYRDRPFDPARNLTLLKQEYDKGLGSARIAFYYGKELADVGKWDEAVPVLEKFIAKGEGFVDNLTVGCIRMSRYYMDKGDREAARNYAMLGIRFNAIYAENFVTLATIKEQEGKPDEAITYYKEALTRTLTAGMSQLVDYYGFIPAAKLGAIYLNKKNYPEAIKYAELACKHKPEHPESQRLLATVQDEMRKCPVAPGSTVEQKDLDDLSNFFRNRKLTMEVLSNDGEKADLRLHRKRELKIAWLIPVCDATNPSVRLRRLIVHEKLKSMRVDSRIVEGYQNMGVQEVREKVGDANLVIFTSFGKHELDLMRDMRANGKKVAFDHCEGIFGFPYEDDCMHESDVILCCSTKLEEMTRSKGFAHTTVLKDSVEEREPKKPHQYVERDRPKAVFLGMGGNSFLVTDMLKDAIQGAGYDLVVISEWDNATVKWNIDTWPDDLVSCDVALCPQRVDIQPGKSSVKVTTAMAFGMPVIASPLQAYKEIVVDGENGYIAESKDDWKKALVALKDVNVRRRIGKAAKRAVMPYRLGNNIQNHIKLFEGLINGTVNIHHAERPAVQTEKARDVVDIIIPSYNNLEYLKLCLTSVRINTLHPFHLMVSDAGSDAEMWEYLKTLKGITVLGAQGKRLTFSESCNAGIEASRSKYFVIMNSDVIVSKGWLTNMVHHMDTVHRLASCGVLSNCDMGWLHSNPRKPDSPVYPMRLEKASVDLHPGMKLGEITPHLDELYAFMEASNERYKDKFTPQEWVAAYCTIFARSAINEVGLFDTQFKNGCEDLDLCMRLSKTGFACGQSVGSFVFHFGGITRASYERELDEKGFG